MKLSLLHEANFSPKQDPKIAVRQQLGSEISKMAEYPERTGSDELPTGDPIKDTMMGIQNPHATRADKIGREQSGGGRPKRLGGQKDIGRRRENAIGSDAEPESTIPAEEAEGAIDADDYPVDGEPKSAAHGQMGERSSQRSARPPNQTSVGRMWGNRYPGRKA